MADSMVKFVKVRENKESDYIESNFAIKIISLTFDQKKIYGLTAKKNKMDFLNEIKFNITKKIHGLITNQIKNRNTVIIIPNLC